MPDYCEESLIRFRHELRKIMDQPHKHTLLPVYRANIQYTKTEDKSSKLGKADKLFIQQVTGTFLYYTRVLDGMMLVALSVVTSDQVSPTEETTRKTNQCLDYVASHPDTILTFSASSMVRRILPNWSTSKNPSGMLFLYV